MKITIVTLLAALFSAVAGLGYVQHLKREAAELRADHAEQQLVDAKSTIDQLHERETRLNALRRQAEAVQTDLQRVLSNREIEIRRLQRENQELRDWADQPLPDAVARLRRRPALTGADAYRQHLSDTEPVHAAGSGSGDQRRSEPGGGAL